MAIFVTTLLPFHLAPIPRSDHQFDILTNLANILDLEIQFDETTDFEDWIEPITLLRSALHLGFETHLLKHNSIDKVIASVPGSQCPKILLGPIPTSQKINVPKQGYIYPQTPDDLTNHYADLEVFKQYAFRKTAQAHMPGDTDTARAYSPIGHGTLGTDLHSALENFKNTDILIKQVYPAKSMPLLPFYMSDDPIDTVSDFLDTIGFHMCRFEGDLNSLLIQEKITMQNETRFFVIDHKVICGAACIETHTPLNNEGGTRLDPIFERDRNQGNISRSPYLRDKLLQTADDIAKQIALEEPRLTAYSLDLAVTFDGQPLFIELNPASNSGLYAIDTHQLVKAIVDHASTISQKPHEQSTTPR